MGLMGCYFFLDLGFSKLIDHQTDNHFQNELVLYKFKSHELVPMAILLVEFYLSFFSRLHWLHNPSFELFHCVHLSVSMDYWNLSYNCFHVLLGPSCKRMRHCLYQTWEGPHLDQLSKTDPSGHLHYLCCSNASAIFLYCLKEFQALFLYLRFTFSTLTIFFVHTSLLRCCRLACGVVTLILARLNDWQSMISKVTVHFFLQSCRML